MPSKPQKVTPEAPMKDKKTHSKTITIFSSVILAIIVVTFVGAPVVSKIAGDSTVHFGSYDGIPIERANGNYFDQFIQEANRQAESNAMYKNLPEEQKRMLVWNQAFQRAAIYVAFKREAELAGIVVSDDFVNQALLNHRAYLDANGKYSSTLYHNTAAADQYKYFKETQNELLIKQYIYDQAYSGIVSENQKTFLASMAYPQRKFSFVTFTDADFPDALVKDYAQKNKNLFRSINVSKITISSSEGDANKFRDEAANGTKTFEDLAKTNSKDAFAQSGGAMNTRYYYELKSEIEKKEDVDKLFGLGKGGLSPVFKKGNEWVFYKVNAGATDIDLNAASTLTTVRGYMTSNDRGQVEDYLEAQAKAFKTAATPKTFADAAKKMGKTVQTTGFVALNFGNFFGFERISSASTDRVFQSLSNNEDFFKKAFRTPKDGITDPVLAASAVLVLKVDDIKEAPAKDDREVSGEMLARYMNQEKEYAMDQAVLDSPKFKNEFEKVFQQK